MPRSGHSGLQYANEFCGPDHPPPKHNRFIFTLSTLARYHVQQRIVIMHQWIFVVACVLIYHVHLDIQECWVRQCKINCGILTDAKERHWTVMDSSRAFRLQEIKRYLHKVLVLISTTKPVVTFLVSLQHACYPIKSRSIPKTSRDSWGGAKGWAQLSSHWMRHPSHSSRCMYRITVD